MAWLIGNDQTLTITGLRDPVTTQYLNAATVTITMKDDAGNNVVGQTWPTTLQYVAASDGDYRGVLESGRQLVEGQRYWAEMTIDAGGGLIGFWRWADIARYRGFDE